MATRCRMDAGAAQHVKRDPHVAHLRVQEPHLGDLGHHGQRHDQHGHHQVRHSQGQDQVVGHVVQRPLQDDGGDDEAVADDAAEDHDAQHYAGGDEVLLTVHGQAKGGTQGRARPVALALLRGEDPEVRHVQGVAGDAARHQGRQGDVGGGGQDQRGHKARAVAGAEDGVVVGVRCGRHADVYLLGSGG